MRVLHVINDLNTGGAEKLVLDTLPLLNRRGLRADLLVLDGTPYPFLRELQATGSCTIHSLGRGSVRNPFHVLRLRSRIAQYPLVHVHLFPSMYWVALARGRGPGGPALVLTEHNTTNRRRDRTVVSVVDRWVYGRYAKVICVSEPAREALASHANLPAERLEVVPNGVDLSRIDAARPIDRTRLFPGAGPETRLVLQVSSFRDQKDQDTLVRALPLLGPDVRLVLAGDGPRREACERLAASLGVGTRVAFLGIRDDVPSLLRTADVVALSSRHEGLSLASIEGLGSGRPFVGSDVPGLREIVDGAGILFPPGDPASFAEVVRGLLADPGRAHEIALRGRARASAFGLPAMVERIADVYATVLGARTDQRSRAG